MSNGDATDKDELRRTLERRIARRELQIAQRGIDAPNEAHEDLAQAKRDLAFLDAIEKSPVSQAVVDVIPAGERHKATQGAIMLLIQRTAELQADLTELKTLFAAEQERDQEDRLKRQHETDMYRVSVEQRLGNVRAAILAQAVATVLGWIFRRRLS